MKPTLDLRPLTADEKALAQRARDAANKRITAQRAELAASLTSKLPRKADREKEAREALPLITSTPVIVFDDELLSITLDYEIVQQLIRSLRRGWTYSVRLEHENPRTQLVVTYEHQSGARRGRTRLSWS